MINYNTVHFVPSIVGCTMPLQYFINLFITNNVLHKYAVLGKKITSRCVVGWRCVGGWVCSTRLVLRVPSPATRYAALRGARSGRYAADGDARLRIRTHARNALNDSRYTHIYRYILYNKL